MTLFVLGAGLWISNTGRSSFVPAPTSQIQVAASSTLSTTQTVGATVISANPTNISNTEDTTNLPASAASKNTNSKIILRTVYHASENQVYIESSDLEGVGIALKDKYLGVFRYRGNDFSVHYGIHEGILTTQESGGTLQLTKIITDVYSSTDLNTENNQKLEQIYYINGEKTNSIQIRQMRQDMYLADNAIWKGIGFFDGKFYLGIFKYIESSNRFSNVFGSHKGELQSDGTLKIHGVNLANMLSSFDITWEKAYKK